MGLEDSTASGRTKYVLRKIKVKKKVTNSKMIFMYHDNITWPDDLCITHN